MNKKQKFSTAGYVMVALLIVAIFGIPYYFFVHKPVTEGITRSQEIVDQCDTDMAILTAKKVKMNRMQNEIDERKADPNVATVQIYDNQSEVMDFLYDVLLKRTTELNIEQNVAYPHDGYVVRRTMSITFKCGSYLAATDIVNKLEASKFLNQITVMAITPVNKTVPGTSDLRAVTTGQVEVNLSIVFFEDYSEAANG